MDTSSPVLVTGASGYVASHLIKILLERGHKVRGTVRSLANKAKYQFLYDLIPEKKDNIELVEADLSEKSCWLPAVTGCQYVFHVASPIPPYVPKDEMEIIGPAVAGTVNVLEASLEAGVKKVVITSSVVTIFFMLDPKAVTEDDWSDESICNAYPKSKIRAEKYAWEFYEQHKDKIEISVVNPSLVFGPVFTKHGNSSETLMAEILKGTYPGILDIRPALVDVRDVAEAHYKAMFNQGTNGRRYIVASREVPMEEIMRSLKQEFEKYGYQIPDKHVTAEEVVASGNPVAQRQVPMIGKSRKFNNERSLKELGLTYRSPQETVIDMAYSLIKQGIVPNKVEQKN